MDQEQGESKWCALKCKNLRIGDYEMKPRYKVVFTQSELKIKVETIGNREFVDVKIPMSEMLMVVASLTGYMPALFIYLSTSACKILRQKLGMTDRNNSFLDITSKDNSQRRLSIFPEFLSDTNIAIIEENLGELLQHVSQDHAYQIFLDSTSKRKNITSKGNKHKQKKAKIENDKDDVESPKFSPIKTKLIQESEPLILTANLGVDVESPSFSPVKTLSSEEQHSPTNSPNTDDDVESPKFSPIKPDFDGKSEVMNSSINNTQLSDAFEEEESPTFSPAKSSGVDVVQAPIADEDDEALLVDLSDEDILTEGNKNEKDLSEIFQYYQNSEEIVKLHFQIAEAVKKNLYKYYKLKTNNSGKYVINDEAEFATFAKEFSHKLRESIKKRYYLDNNTLKGINFSDLDETFVKNKIKFHFKRILKQK